LTDRERYEKALAFAKEKHEGQYRIGGEKYITHPVAVAEILREQGYDTDYQIAALFHDLLEDTDATEAELLALSNERVVKAVCLLTKPEPCNMAHYVHGVKSDEMAFAVKKADRLHNLRCAVCTGVEFRKRYVEETKKWYYDFSEEIRTATAELKETIKDCLS